MPGSRKIERDSPTPAHHSRWDIGSYLRYEHERPDVVVLSWDWEGDVPKKTIGAILQVLRGDYPDEVYLAELPIPGSWTRKLKLFVPGQGGQVVTVVGGGAPRLWLGNEVAYQLPNPRAKHTSEIYRHFLAEHTLSTQKIPVEEVLGGLALPQGEHIQYRMTQAQALTGHSIAVPTLVARGTLSIPKWEGAVLAYSEAVNHHPASYLQSEFEGRGFDRRWGVEVFRSGVRSLFRTLRAINIREGGMFHGDLVHRVHGGSANLGFTLEGDAVLTGWGRRVDERIEEWSVDDFRRHQMREVTGALAGLVDGILGSELGREGRQHIMVDTVRVALEEYSGRQGIIDPVTLAIGLPTDMGRFGKPHRKILDDYDIRNCQHEVILRQESGQLPEEIKSWLVQSVVRYL
jgi:hypothetical protein